MALVGCTEGERPQQQPPSTAPAQPAPGASLLVADGYRVSVVTGARLAVRDTDATLPANLMAVGSPFIVERTGSADGPVRLRLDITHPEGPLDSTIAASYGLAQQGRSPRWQPLHAQARTRNRLSVAGISNGARLVVFRRDWTAVGDAVDQAGVTRLLAEERSARCRDGAPPPAWAKAAIALDDPDVASCVEGRGDHVVLRLFNNNPGSLLVSAARPLVDWVAFDGASTRRPGGKFAGLSRSEGFLPARGSVALTVSRGPRTTERFIVRPSAMTFFLDVLSSAMDGTPDTTPTSKARRMLLQCGARTAGLDAGLTTVSGVRRTLLRAADQRLRPCLRKLSNRTIIDKPTAEQIAATFASLVNFGHRDPYFQTAWAPLRRTVEEMLEWDSSFIAMRSDDDGGVGVALADAVGDVRKASSWSSPRGYAPDIRFVEFVNRGDDLGARIQVVGALTGRLIVEMSNRDAGPEDAAVQLTVVVDNGRVTEGFASYYREVISRSSCPVASRTNAATHTLSMLISQRCLKSNELFAGFHFDDAVMSVMTRSHRNNLMDEMARVSVPHVR